MASAFKIMKSDKKFNMLANLPIEDQKDIRKRVVSMVLATDMQKHFADLGKFKV